jgi:hypothetical protein
MKPAGNPWVPANPMGTGLGKISNPSWVRVFLMGIDIFHGYGFWTAKPSGFVPVAISSWEEGGHPRAGRMSLSGGGGWS